jgi:UDP-glucose 4-epimerase
VDYLLREGHCVRILDNLSTGQNHVNADVQLIVGDVADRASVVRAMDGMDGCFHLAAVSSVEACTRDWLGSHRTNLSGTIVVLEAAARRHTPVVYASSAAVYGNVAQVPITEASAVAPLSAYGADKLGCELHARVAGEVFGVPTLGLRLFNIYGPRQDPGSPYSGVISVFCRRVSARQPIVIHGDGQQVRDFVYVSDVVRAFAGAIRAASTQARVLCICTGRPSSILDIATVLGELRGFRAEVEFTTPRAGDVRTSIGDPRLAREILGFDASVALRDGLGATLDWIDGAQLAGG